MKKIIAILTALSLLIGLMPPVMSFAGTPTITNADWPEFSTLSAADQSVLLKEALQGTPINNLRPGEKPSAKTLYMALQPLKGKSNDPEYQRIVVYNYSPAHKTSRGFGPLYPTNQEYQYLGYDINGNKVTNDLYTNGSIVGERNPYDLPKFQYQKIDTAMASWERVSEDVATKMMETPFRSEDETNNTNPANYTLKQLLNKTLNGNTSNTNSKPYLLMQSKASLSAEGSVRTVYKGWNSQTGRPVKSYNTFTIPSVSKKFKPKVSINVFEDAACTKALPALDIAPGQDSVTVYVKVTANVSLRELGLERKEQEYMEAVTNKFFSDDKSVKGSSGTVLKDFSNPEQMASSFLLTLKRKDYSRDYKTITLSGASTALTKYGLILVEAANVASTQLKVRAIDPNVLDPNFKIYYKGSDRTDSSIKLSTAAIDQPLTVDLKDTSFVPADNEVVNWNWFVKDHVKNDIHYFGYTKDTAFTLQPADVSKYVSNGRMTFIELVKDKIGRTWTREHFVEIVLKDQPDPSIPAPEILPKAFVQAPGSVRAGQRCMVSGEGTSGNGVITDYSFDLASNFKVLSTLSSQEHEGTFLAFDHSANDDWSETTGLTVTDVVGKTASDSTKTLVKHPIVPVFRTNGVYKVNRTIELDSTASTGTEYYPIDKVTWTIKPIDGQSINVVKPHVPSKVTGNTMTIEGAKPKVDFKQLGHYEVWMDVHATCTFAGQTHRTASKQVYGIINIAPDEPPVAKLSVPAKSIRELENGQAATITVWDESFSPDGDAIGKRKFYARFDSNNDKSTADETWELIYEGPNAQFEYSARSVGYYEFRVEVEETNDSILSPFWNTATDTIKANSDTQPLSEKQMEVINVAPIISILADRKKLDLVLVTDYEGSDFTALKTELDLLTKDLFEKGVDIEVKVFTDKIRNGSVKAPIYIYNRYINLSYVSDYSISNGTTNINTTGTRTDRVAWETREQLETAYLPSYAPPSLKITHSTYNDSMPYDPVTRTSSEDRGIKLLINAESDPYLKNGTLKIREYLNLNRPPEYGGGAVERYNNIRDINVSIDGHFTKADIKAYVDMPLYTMNLELLRQTISYREGSDRQMIFVMKTGDSLTTLNQTFAEYVKQNNVVVGAVNGFDMASQYGGLAVQDAEFIYDNKNRDQPSESYNKEAWVNDIRTWSAPVGVAFKTEDGRTYKLPSYQTTNYPTVLQGYTFRNFENEIRLFNSFREYYGENNSFDLHAWYMNGNENFTYDKTYYNNFNTANNRESYTKRDRDGDEYQVALDLNHIVMFQYLTTNNWSEDTRHIYYIRYGNLYKLTFDKFTTNYSLSTATLEANNVEVVFAGKNYNYTDAYPLDSTVMFYYKDLNKTRVLWQTSNKNQGYLKYYMNEMWLDGSIANVKFHPTGTTRMSDTDRGSSYRKNRYAQATIDFTTSLGVSIRMTYAYTKYNENTYDNAVYVLSLPNGYKPIAMPSNGRRYKYDNYYHYQSYVYAYRDTETSVTSYFLSPTGDIYKSDGNWDGAGNLNLTPVTQGLNIKKFNLYSRNTEGYGDLHLMALTHDGKLFSAPIGSQLLIPQNMTNIVKDPRTLAQPVVNALSMRKLLNQSSANRISGSFGEYGNRLRADYEYLKYQTKVTLLLGETLKYDQLYYDREGDSLGESAMAIQHDPNALESPLGTDVNHNKTLSNWDAKLTKTGIYKIQPKVKDKPSFDERFSDYSLWNKDDTTIEVLVHRKPIASMKLSMTPTAPYTVTARDSNSRDLDHVSMATPLRGITEVEWGIKKVYDDEWEISKGALNTAMSKTLETGETYIVSYRVKDVEGQWSEPVTEQIVAGMNLLLDGKLKPENPTHSLSKFQTGNNVVFHELWTSYPLAHHLEIQMYDGNTPILDKVTFRKEWGHVRAETYPERDWHDAGFNIPRTINGVPLADKTYNFVVTAFDSSNPSIKKQKQFQVTTVSNSAPAISFISTTPVAPYEGDVVTSICLPSDPDNDLLRVDYYLWHESEAPKLVQTFTSRQSGVQLALPAFLAQKTGNYYQKVVVTDPLGATAEATKSIWVSAMSVAAVVTPADPMAGDMLTFNISTTGYVDRVEIIPDQTWVNADKRVAMGYTAAPYQAALKAGETYKALQVDMDQSKVTDSKAYKYIVWVSVPQTMTLKKQRLRAPYVVTVRAWKGSIYRDMNLTIEIEGSVLQTLKMGTPNK